MTLSQACFLNINMTAVAEVGAATETATATVQL